MSVLDFIASLISSMAWPLFALGIAFLFRHQIRKLLAVAGPLRRLKGPGGLEAFDDTVAVETKQSATEALELVGVSGQTSLTLLEDLDAVAQVSARGAVVDAATRVESRLLAMLQEKEVEIGPNRSLGTIASVAYKKGIMGEATFQAVLGLRVMRNLAVHGGEEDLDAARAMEFLSLAEAVLYSLGVRPG